MRFNKVYVYNMSPARIVNKFLFFPKKLKLFGRDNVYQTRWLERAYIRQKYRKFRCHCEDVYYWEDDSWDIS